MIANILLVVSVLASAAWIIFRAVLPALKESKIKDFFADGSVAKPKKILAGAAIGVFGAFTVYVIWVIAMCIYFALNHDLLFVVSALVSAALIFGAVLPALKKGKSGFFADGSVAKSNKLLAGMAVELCNGLAVCACVGVAIGVYFALNHILA